MKQFAYYWTVYQDDTPTHAIRCTLCPGFTDFAEDSASAYVKARQHDTRHPQREN